MVVKPESGRIARKLVWQDLLPMVKTKLSELWSPVGTNPVQWEMRLKPTSVKGNRKMVSIAKEAIGNCRSPIETHHKTETFVNETKQGVKENLQGSYQVMMTYPGMALGSERNKGYGAPIVVRERESRLHGEGEQVQLIAKNERKAKC